MVLQPMHQASVGRMSAANRATVRRQHRRKDQRENQSAGQRKAICHGHWSEYPPRYALHREQRDECDENNEGREEDRLSSFGCGFGDQIKPVFVARDFMHAPVDVLHHHDG